MGAVDQTEDFFDLSRAEYRKKDSAVSLSEHDANSPTASGRVKLPTSNKQAPKQQSIPQANIVSPPRQTEPSEGSSQVSPDPKVLDFDNRRGDEKEREKDDTDFFEKLQYPLKKRSLSNGDSFLKQMHQESEVENSKERIVGSD